MAVPSLVGEYVHQPRWPTKPSVCSPMKWHAKCLSNKAPMLVFKTSSRYIALPFVEINVKCLSTPGLLSCRNMWEALDISAIKLNEKKSTNDEFA